jgi:hypothetical protein
MSINTSIVADARQTQNPTLFLVGADAVLHHGATLSIFLGIGGFSVRAASFGFYEVRIPLSIHLAMNCTTTSQSKAKQHIPRCSFHLYEGVI